MSLSSEHPIQWTLNHIPKSEDTKLHHMCREEMEKAGNFHKSFPQYDVTPLTRLSGLAEYLGLKRLYVKDESYRFGLNAFKVLGGSYAIARHIAKELGKDISQMPYQVLTSKELRDEFGQAAFFTATDGNHGRGVAWAANKLGQKCVVRMPKGTTQTRLENIAKENATVTIENLNYDDCVRMAAKEAAETTRGIVVQDTAWEGYEEIPGWIMEGYTTLALEIVEQLGDVRPTHLFLQAGVGAMAGAVAGFFANYYGGDCPVITVVEPHNANCLFRTAQAGDGRLHNVGGDLSTIMAGLACGEPCSIAWRVLEVCAQNFLSVPDYVAAKGMRVLGSPLGGDPRIISGESGAATVGLVAEIMENDAHIQLRRQLKLDRDSRILCISTEGDTDRENYRKIVWDGQCPSTSQAP